MAHEDHLSTLHACTLASIGPRRAENYPIKCDTHVSRNSGNNVKCNTFADPPAPAGRYAAQWS